MIRLWSFRPSFHDVEANVQCLNHTNIVKYKEQYNLVVTNNVDCFSADIIKRSRDGLGLGVGSSVWCG